MNKELDNVEFQELKELQSEQFQMEQELMEVEEQIRTANEEEKIALNEKHTSLIENLDKIYQEINEIIAGDSFVADEFEEDENENENLEAMNSTQSLNNDIFGSTNDLDVETTLSTNPIEFNNSSDLTIEPIEIFSSNNSNQSINSLENNKDIYENLPSNIEVEMVDLSDVPNREKQKSYQNQPLTSGNDQKLQSDIGNTKIDLIDDLLENETNNDSNKFEILNDEPLPKRRHLHFSTPSDSKEESQVPTTRQLNELKANLSNQEKLDEIEESNDIDWLNSIKADLKKADEEFRKNSKNMRQYVQTQRKVMNELNSSQNNWTKPNDELKDKGYSFSDESLKNATKERDNLNKDISFGQNEDGMVDGTFNQDTSLAPITPIVNQNKTSNQKKKVINFRKPTKNMRNYLIRTISVVSTALLLITIGAKVHNSKINEPIAEMTEVTTNNDASDKLNNLETESFIVLEDTPSDFVSYEESHQTETIVNETENDLEQTESPSVKDEQKTSESIVLPEQSTEEQAIESVASTEQSTEEETEAITEQISEEVVDEKTGAIESEKVSPVSPQSEPTELIDLVTESPEDTNSDSLLKEYTDFLSGTSEQVVETQVDQQTETSIQIGKTITLNEEARIYGDEYSAYLEGTSYRPYYKNDEKRVIIGVAVEKDNQLVKIDASQSDANQKINDLINNGGQIVSVLTANQKFLSDYNGSESLLNDEIRAYNEGWYNVNDIAQENTKGLQR